MTKRSETWVCPHDPWGNDRDTATYCPQAVRMIPPYQPETGEKRP